MKTGYFSHEFLTSLPSDRLEALVALYQEFDRLGDSFFDMQEDFVEAENHDLFIETLAILRAYSEYTNLKMPLVNIGPNKDENAKNIYAMWRTNGKEWSAELTKRNGAVLYTDKSSEYANIFNLSPAYEFTETDFARVQVLINELRQLISESNLVSDDHKRRLLRRLEAMQAELHKKTSDIDRFWGFIAEVSITTRKFGEDLKPISERASELGKIVIAVVLAKEGLKALPAISNLLDLAK